MERPSAIALGLKSCTHLEALWSRSNEIYDTPQFFMHIDVVVREVVSRNAFSARAGSHGRL